MIIYSQTKMKDTDLLRLGFKYTNYDRVYLYEVNEELFIKCFHIANAFVFTIDNERDGNFTHLFATNDIIKVNRLIEALK